REASSAHHLLDAPALGLVHEQAALRTAPEHVFGAGRPFALDEVTDFALAQARSILLTQLAVADYLVGERAVPPENSAQCLCGYIRVAGEKGVARFGARSAVEVAARQCLAAGPRRL